MRLVDAFAWESIQVSAESRLHFDRSTPISIRIRIRFSGGGFNPIPIHKQELRSPKWGLNQLLIFSEGIWRDLEGSADFGLNWINERFSAGGSELMDAIFRK